MLKIIYEDIFEILKIIYEINKEGGFLKIFLYGDYIGSIEELMI